jgi:geranylgeranyl pyrophosphate synthase
MTTFGCQIGIALQMRNDVEELKDIADGQSDTGCVRDDDLRHARVTWPWAWAIELVDETRCRSLTRRLETSSRERRLVAGELLSIVRSHGEQVVAGLIRDQVRVLGEHVVDRHLLERMRDCLQPIERGGVEAERQHSLGA